SIPLLGEHDDVARSNGRQTLTFVVLATAALGFSLLQSLVIPAIPSLERTLHTSESAASWLLTGYFLSAAVATPVLGRVGDAIGKGKMIGIVLVALSVGTLISALATNLPVMLMGRVIQGVGGAVFPLAFGIIRDEFAPKRVPGTIGVLSAILGLGTGVGIVLAGPIIDHLSYHWLFWFPFFMSVAATAATFAFVPESPVRAERAINWVGALVMSGWLVTALVAVSYGPTWNWGSVRIVGLFAATAVLMVLWIWSESRARSPLVDMEMMRIPAVWSTNLASLLFGFGLFAMFTTVPQFAQTPSSQHYGFGASVTQSGLYLLPFALAMVIVAPGVGHLTAAFGSKAILVAGSLFSAASYGLLVLNHHQPWTLYASAGLLGVGMALGYASMVNLIVDAVPAEQTGVATGMNTNIRSVGSALGSGVATSLVISRMLPDGYPRLGGYVLAFAASGIAMVVAALAALTIPRRRDAATAEERTPTVVRAEAQAAAE
ncbi:MAG: MFS transporter, partial [Acidimicrobiaceae bacterium]|nr:MFS transporter [Acidimicrobiaceae bacterium]